MSFDHSLTGGVELEAGSAGRGRRAWRSVGHVCLSAFPLVPVPLLPRKPFCVVHAAVLCSHTEFRFSS